MALCRVLVVSYKFQSDYAGWLQQTLTMIQACDHKLVSFTWISPYVIDQPCEKEWVYLDARRIGSQPRGAMFIDRVAFGVDVARYLIRNRNTYDIVYCPLAYSPTDVVAVAARCINKPLVVRVARGELSANRYSGRLRRWLLPRLADALVVLNRNLLTDLKDSVYHSKTHWHPNGVNTEIFHPPTPDQRVAARQRWQIPEGEKAILFVGSIVSRKGVDTLVSAYTDVLRSYQACGLYLAGPLRASEGAEELQAEFVHELQATIRQQELGAKVHFLDYVSNVPQLMHAVDVFVLPSLLEGMPNVLLEAMASGLPCVASDIPGVQEVITNGENGRLFQPGDAESLAQQLIWLLSTPEESQRLGCMARYTIDKDFSIRKTFQNYQDIFLKLASR